MKRHVSILTPDVGLFERILQEYPDRIFERQVTLHKCTLGVRFYEITGLNLPMLLKLIEERDEYYDIFYPNNGRFFNVMTRMGDTLNLVE